MTRSERQDLALQRWVDAKGFATIVAFTGFGKTRLGTNAITRLKNKKIDANVLIVVPTEILQIQWRKLLNKLNMSSFCDVVIINTVIKHKWKYTLMIVDECHIAAAPEFRKIFLNVDYERILCLTATLKRLDGLEKIIEYYAPVCDEISLKEGLKNNWVAEYREYKVLLDVDLTDYNILHRQFLEHFSFFDYDLSKALNCVKYPDTQKQVALQTNNSLKVVKAHTYSFMRLLRERKDWVMNHPQKILIAKQILQHRQDKKVLTFSASINMAKLLGVGDIIHSKMTKKQRKLIMESYLNKTQGPLHSVDALRVGMDLPDISVAVIVGYNSSMLKKIQTIGRVIRKEEDKVSEVFTLVIRGTIEEQWFAKSSRNGSYITIDESDLNDLLNETHTKQEEALYFE